MPRPVHFEIHASEPDVLIKFYADLFGWKINRWGEEEYWLVETGEDGPGINGAIMQRRGPAPEKGAPVMGASLAVYVDDIHAAFAKGKELGAAEALPVGPVPGVGWVAYLGDPDGNILGLYQEDAEAK